MPRPSLCARAQFYCTYVVCTLCITTDIRIITVYKDNSSQIKSSKTAAFAKPAIREKLIGGGGAARGMLGQAWLRRHYLRRRAAPRLVHILGQEFQFYIIRTCKYVDYLLQYSQTMPSGAVINI